jgi:hypothetical protein
LLEFSTSFSAFNYSFTASWSLLWKKKAFLIQWNFNSPGRAEFGWLFDACPLPLRKIWARYYSAV